MIKTFSNFKKGIALLFILMLTVSMLPLSLMSANAAVDGAQSGEEPQSGETAERERERERESSGLEEAIIEEGSESTIQAFGATPFDGEIAEFNLSGIVLFNSAEVSDATIVLSNKNTGLMSIAQTNFAGEYFFSDLPEGDYDIRVEEGELLDIIGGVVEENVFGFIEGSISLVSNLENIDIILSSYAWGQTDPGEIDPWELEEMCIIWRDFGEEAELVDPHFPWSLFNEDMCESGIILDMGNDGIIVDGIIDYTIDHRPTFADGVATSTIMELLNKAGMTSDGRPSGPGYTIPVTLQYGPIYKNSQGNSYYPPTFLKISNGGVDISQSNVEIAFRWLYHYITGTQNPIWSLEHPYINGYSREWSTLSEFNENREVWYDFVNEDFYPAPDGCEWRLNDRETKQRMPNPFILPEAVNGVTQFPNTEIDIVCFGNDDLAPPTITPASCSAENNGGWIFPTITPPNETDDVSFTIFYTSETELNKKGYVLATAKNDYEFKNPLPDGWMLNTTTTAIYPFELEAEWYGEPIVSLEKEVCSTVDDCENWVDTDWVSRWVGETEKEYLVRAIITNNGKEPLTEVSFKDSTSVGPNVIWGSYYTPEDSTTAIALNGVWTGNEYSYSFPEDFVLPIGESIAVTGVVSTPKWVEDEAGWAHEDTAAVDAIGEHSLTPVDDDSEMELTVPQHKAPTPFVNLDKGILLSNVTTKDDCEAIENTEWVIPQDKTNDEDVVFVGACFVKEALMTVGEEYDITFRITNNGPEDLEQVTLTDKTLVGGNNISNLSCDWGENTDRVLKVGESINCKGTLKPAIPDEHKNKASVVAIGIESGKFATDNSEFTGNTIFIVDTPALGGSGLGWLPWLIALLIASGATVYVVHRKRSNRIE